MPTSANVEDWRDEEKLIGLPRYLERRQVPRAQGLPWEQEEKQPWGGNLHRLYAPGSQTVDPLAAAAGYNDVGMRPRPLRPQYRDPLAIMLPGGRDKYSDLYKKENPAGQKRGGAIMWRGFY